MNPLNGIEGIISSIGIPDTVLQNQIPKQPIDANTLKVDFKELLNNAIGAVNDTQVSADVAIQKLAAGENIELHSVMLAAEKASLTLQLAMQIKNKITDAYQEIIRMSI
ncbi:MAG: flagellar hook-basal body complex protein FliE [bacterium]